MKNLFKKLVVIALTGVLLLGNTIPAQAEDTNTAVTSGQCGDNAYWNFDSSTGTLTISGTGAIYNYPIDEYNYITAPWRNLAYTFNQNGQFETKAIKKIVVQNGITSIGDWIFWSIRSVYEIDIAKTVTKIGEGSFGYCAYDDDVYETYEYVKLTLRNGLKTIGNQAFNGCNFKSVTIPDTVTSIGNEVFGGVKTVVIGKNVTKIGNDNFSPCYENPISMKVTIKSKKLKSIGSQVFCMSKQSCKKLTIYMPSSKYDSYSKLITKGLDKYKSKYNKLLVKNGRHADWDYRKPTYKRS